MFGGQVVQPQSLFGQIESAGQPSTTPTTNNASLFQQSTSQTITTSQSTSSTSSAQPTVTTTSSGGKKTLKEIINYTQTRELTKQEIEAFNADKFVLGKIPEHAPPAV